MSDKINKISTLYKELDYLKGEYETVKLWGSRPDGDVKFEGFMQWLSENDHLVEHMLKVAKQVKDL